MRVLTGVTLAFFVLICDADGDITRGYHSRHPHARLTVEYHRPIAELLEAGEYQWTDNELTDENFPPSDMRKKRTITIELVKFDKPLSHEEVLHALNERRLRPATIRELLTLYSVYPSLCEKHAIIALGSLHKQEFGWEEVPYLNFFNIVNKPYLYLMWLKNVSYSRRWSFAAVKK